MSTNTFRVASLNILWKPEDLAERLDLFQTEIERLSPDVVCLQEISPAIKRLVMERMRDLGYGYNSGIAHILDSKQGHGVVTFTKVRSVHQLIDLSLEGFLPEGIPAVSSSVVLPDGEHYLHVMNTHLVWGSRAAGLRRRQVQRLAQQADEAWSEQRAASVLVGDLNSVPQSSAIRFLKGLEDDGDGKGTLWVDAWDYFGQDPKLEMTNVPAVNTLAAQTCLNHDLDPQLVPARRIDYAFTHEYNYGRVGSPTGFGLWCDRPNADGIWVSDHSGVWLDVKTA